MLPSILLPFFTILVTEFLDKSQLSLILLSSKTKRHIPLLLGAFFAFLIVDGVAIFFGAYLTTIVPKVWINLLAAGVFILFGIKLLLEHDDKKQHMGKLKNVFLSSFTLIFISEWGDKTQLAAAVFATRYDPIPVLIGVLGALMLLSVAAVFLSKVLLSRVDRGIMTKVAGIIFIFLGISFFFFN